MVMKKGVYAKLFFLIFFIFSFAGSVSSLGVGPSKVEMDFKPGLEQTISYTVFGGSTNDFEIYVRGDLAPFVTLDKEVLSGNDRTFRATIKLPDRMEKPGPQSFYIGVREKIDPELIRGNIGTAVVIEVLGIIYVPYPGRYLEIDLKGHDVNINEPVNFQLNIFSKGDEDVVFTPRVEIYSSNGEKRDELVLQERTLFSQEDLSLSKTLDTSRYNPGTYNAVAVVDYGNIAKDEAPFRIGDLKIDILSYTSKLVIGKLQKFELDVQSGWNNAIDGVYGEISVLNGSRILDRFKTTTAPLIPWENKTIEGYFDTSNYSIGFYDANITLFYFGGERGSTTSKLVKIEFVKGKSLLIWYVVGGAGLLIIIILLVIKHFHKPKKIRNKR
jgi:hypothetical protein